MVNETQEVLQREINVTVEKWDGYYVASCYAARRHQMSVVTQGKTLDELVANVQEAIGLSLEGENPADYGLVDYPAITLTLRLEMDEPPAQINLRWTGMFYTD